MEEVALEPRLQRWIGFHKVRGRDNERVSFRMGHLLSLEAQVCGHLSPG